MPERNLSLPAEGPEGAVFIELVLETFLLNGRLLAARDRLTQDLGLSNARWHVLDAINVVGKPLTVAQIARHMGVKRQSVQRIADLLADEGIVEYVDNPKHRRAKLVQLTGQGQSVLEAARLRQSEWANCVAAGLGVQDLSAAVAVLQTLRDRLDQGEGGASSQRIMHHE